MKCVKCSTEISDEMGQCPKCKAYTIMKTEGTVISEPRKEQLPNGETFIYFNVQTAEREIPFEVKQGFETEMPVKNGDEVVLEFQKYKERTATLRVRKLLNKTSDVLFNYHAGCLLPLLGLVAVLGLLTMLITAIVFV
jgi:hypothetical protein